MSRPWPFTVCEVCRCHPKLVRAARAGDKAALEGLYRRIFPPEKEAKMRADGVPNLELAVVTAWQRLHAFLDRSAVDQLAELA